jgi:hypothetical protein
VTLWIDKVTFLVRRIDREHTCDKFRTETTTTVMRKLLRVFSGIGFLVYGTFILLVFLISDKNLSSVINPAYELFVSVIAPLLYLGLCFVTTLKALRKQTRWIAGTVAHLAIMPTVLAALSVGAFPCLIAVVLCAGLWIGAMLARDKAGPPSEGFPEPKKET